MLNQIIKTISSFNYVAAEEPVIKAQPKFEDKAPVEVKEGDKILIAKDDMIIKFQIANNDEYFKIEKPEDVKLKAYHVKGKDEKEKYEVEEVEAAKALLRVFKEGDDISVVLNFQQILKYLDKDEKEIIKEIVISEMGLNQVEREEVKKLITQFKFIAEKYITKDSLKIFGEEHTTTLIDFLTAYSEAEITALIPTFKELKAYIGGITLIAERDVKIEDLKKDLESIQTDHVELKKAITDAQKSTDIQTAINTFVPVLKTIFMKIIDDMIKILEIFVQNLQRIKLYKKLSDAKFGYAFQVTLKGVKDEKIIKNVLTNFFIIKDKKLEEVKKDNLHFVDEADDPYEVNYPDEADDSDNSNDPDEANDSNKPNDPDEADDSDKPNDPDEANDAKKKGKPFYRTFWFWGIVGVVLLIVALVCFVKFKKNDEDNDE